MNPRLLLLEDDAVCAAFLCEALRSLPADIDHAPDLAAARRLADSGHSLWLFDARLPDGYGAELLAELHARGLQVPALALTADDDPAVLQQLEGSGFVKALSKPLTKAVLQDAVRECLAGASVLPWDDTVARTALGGDPAAVRALRQLFVQELPAQMREVQAAFDRGNAAALREHLHRLKAGCGFVGAMRLLAAVRALHSAPADAAELERFRACAGELLAGS